MSILVKHFTAPMPGGEKTLRLFVPGFVASIAAGVAGFVWLLSLREWASAFGGLALGIAINLGIMGLVVSPNKKLFDEVDRAVEAGNDRALALTVWFESYFLHAAKAITIFLALASPILLLRGGGGEERLLPAALLGLCLADPPQGFLTDEGGDKDWHATFLPFCQIVPLVLAVGAGVWRLPLWSLVGPYALVVAGSAAVMARFNLRRYRAKMSAPGEPAKPAAKPQGPASRSVTASQFSPDNLARLAAMPGAHIEISLKEAPRKKKRLPPGAFRAGGEMHSLPSTPASRRHSNHRPKGRH